MKYSAPIDSAGLTIPELELLRQEPGTYSREHDDGYDGTA